MPFIKGVAPWLSRRQITQAKPAPSPSLNVTIEGIQILSVVGRVNGIPGPLGTLCVEEQHIVDVAVESPPLLRIAMGTTALPDDLGAEEQRSEDRVENRLEIVAGGRIAM